jgi:hypothetical protein
LSVAVGSGAPHPPLSPPVDHGSNSAEFVDAATAGLEAGAATGFTTGADRLNAELILALGAGLEDITGDETLVGGGTGGGAGDGAAKPENSSLANKSFGTIGTAGLGIVNAEACAKEKSRPFNEDVLFGTGGGCCATLGGVLSKKFPPLRGGGEVTCGADGVDLGANAVVLPRFENADCDCVDCGVGFEAVVLGKLRPAKASVMPPNGSFCPTGGDPMLPNDGCRPCVCCGGGCGLGAVAYRESMDCLRSGLEDVGLEAALEGLPAFDDGGPPKKSSPSSDSPCLGGRCTAAGGPTRVGFVFGMSAVLGLIGGAMGLSSPKRSMLAVGAAAGARRICDAPWC